MYRLLFFIGLLCNSAPGFSQQGFLFVKKGIHKKRIYQEGDSISLKLEDGSYRVGRINLLRNDTIFISREPIPKSAVRCVYLERKPKVKFPKPGTVALIAAGSALTSIGLAVDDKAHKSEAYIAGPVIGFGPLLLRHFGSRALRGISRHKYRIGRKFYLQVLDFHLPGRRTRPF
jgi:hypothetical protein